MITANKLDFKQKKELLMFLLQYVTPHKKELFKKVIKERTKYLTVVLEDIYQPHNASAVLRSCDCFGVQDVHVIENSNIYEVNPDVALGSTKWLTLFKYHEKRNNTVDTFNQLKDRGYRIVATTPHKHDFLINELPLDKKTALVFGTEKNGLSPIAMDHADVFVKIPMYGFTESYNISVSAALVLYELSKRLRTSKNINWKLNEEEIVEIQLNWARNVLKRSETLEKGFLKR